MESCFNQSSNEIKGIEMNEETKQPNYSLEVYDDHAIIKGWLTSDMIKVLLKLCNKEGFKYFSPFTGGFKLVKEAKAKNDQ